MTSVKSLSSLSGMFFPDESWAAELQEQWTLFWRRSRSYWMPVLLVSTTALLWSGCSGFNGGGGGGGVTNPDQTIEGTYESTPKTGQASQDYEVKTITFGTDGTFKVFRTKAKFSAQNPDITGTYEVIDQDIVFKNPDGEEFEERGRFLDNGSTRFEWKLFTIDVFVKKSSS